MSLIINQENPSITVDKTEVSQIPACVFWLPCDESDLSITILNDVVNNETVTVLASTPSGAGAVQIPNTVSAPYSGTLPALPADFIVLCLAKLSTVINAIGYGSGAQKISISATSVIIGAGGTDTLDGVTAGSLVKTLIIKDTTGDAYLYQSAPGVELVNTLNPVTASGTVTPSVDEMVIQAFSGNTDLYGYAAFDLSANGVPADIVSWADWTMEQWAANNKVLPHRFTEL